MNRFRRAMPPWAALPTALLAGGLPATAAGQAGGPDFYRVVDVAAGDVLAIRSGPDASAPKIGEIPSDADGIRNLGCEGGLSFAQWMEATEAQREASRHDRWCKVAFGGVEGWAPGRFLGEGSAPAAR